MAYKLLKTAYFQTLANRYMFARIMSSIKDIFRIKENSCCMRAVFQATNALNYLLIVPWLLLFYIASSFLADLSDEEKLFAKKEARTAAAEKICPAIWLFDI